jgi:hypothetical protein
VESVEPKIPTVKTNVPAVLANIPTVVPDFHAVLTDIATIGKRCLGLGSNSGEEKANGE